MKKSLLLASSLVGLLQAESNQSLIEDINKTVSAIVSNVTVSDPEKTSDKNVSESKTTPQKEVASPQTTLNNSISKKFTFKEENNAKQSLISAELAKSSILKNDAVSIQDALSKAKNALESSEAFKAKILLALDKQKSAQNKATKTVDNMQKKVNEMEVKKKSATSISYAKIAKISAEDELSMVVDNINELDSLLLNAQNYISSAKELMNDVEIISAEVSNTLLDATKTKLENAKSDFKLAKDASIVLTLASGESAIAKLQFTKAKADHTHMNAEDYKSVETAKDSINSAEVSLKKYETKALSNLQLVSASTVSITALTSSIKALESYYLVNSLDMQEVTPLKDEMNSIISEHTATKVKSEKELAKASQLLYDLNALQLAIHTQANTIFETKYNRALELFQKEAFLKAFTAFKELFWVNLEHIDVNFYLGRSAFELDDYDTAIASYERILILDPNHMRTRLEMARTYFKLEMYEQAQVEFDKVLLLPIPEQVRENINYYISYIEQNRKRSFLNVLVGVGQLSDDNVNNGNEYLPESVRSFSDGNSSVVDNSSGDILNPKIADSAIVANLNVNYIYDMFGKDGLYLQSGASLYSQSYKEQSQSDVLFTAANVALGVKYGGFTFSVPVTYDALTYGGDKYLSTTSSGLNMGLPMSNSLQLQLNIKQQNKSFVQEADKVRDAVRQEVSLGTQSYIDGGTSILTLTVGGAIEDSIDPEAKAVKQRADIKYSTGYFMLNYYNQFFGALTFNVNASIRGLLYDVESVTTEFEDNTEVKEKRTDIIGGGALTLAYTFSTGTSLNLTVNKTISESINHPLFTYDKQSVIFMLQQQF
jgi:tetratricopeptide (TPR) repeat protein